MNVPRTNAYAPALVAVACLSLGPASGCLRPTQRTVAVWVVAGGEDLTHDTPPNPENDVYSATGGGLRLTAALNETVAFQIALRAAAPPAGPFHIRVSDLVGPSEMLSARTAVSVYRAHDVRVEHFRSWHPASTGRPAVASLVPDILVPWGAPRGGGPLVLSEVRNEIVWVDVHVPPTLAPGEYRGQLELRSGDKAEPAFGCEIRLEVLPVALPGRPSLRAICRVDPRDLLAAHLRWPAASAEQTRLLPDVPSHFAAVRLVEETMRLFQAHRTTPVLWASFPKFRPTEARRVEVEWAEYDRLVSGWLDGTAFPNRVRLEVWPMPASIKYPDAQRNGGFDSPQYARLLGAYLAECRLHFADRGWLDRAVVRVCPPGPLSQTAVDRVRRLAGIVRQSEPGLPVVAHLPARSLRGLGWQDAPTIELSGVNTWAPPAMWYEPEVMEHERKLGRRTWFMPDHPPYSGSLAVEALATDPRVLPWQAYRYGASAIWLEHAAELAETAPPSRAHRPWGGAGLVYPAVEYGLRDQPLPSRRLKRLRRGLQDYELLRLLEENGKRLLAQELARQVVRWAGTDACVDNLLTYKEGGWLTEPRMLRLARTLMLRELVLEFEPNAAARREQLRSFSEWSLMMNQAQRVTVSVDGVRLTGAAEGLRAEVLGSVLNSTNRPLQGRWTLPAPPPGWQQTGEVLTRLAPGTRRQARITLDLAGLAYNTEGVYPFDVLFDTEALGAFRTSARLAVAVCPPVETSPRVDGNLEEWPLAANNAAGDFRLCRGPGAAPPTLPTQAFFSLDHEHLFIGVRCALRAGEPPLWQADNTIPIDGPIPWGQDVVEVLLDPRLTFEGTGSDLYCFQVKPTGLLIARMGCRTDPQMGTSADFRSGARAAVRVERDAWVVELALPLKAFGPQARRNRVWGFNVTRLDARRGEYSSWSGARGHCYAPQSLGNLIMLWP